MTGQVSVDVVVFFCLFPVEGWRRRRLAVKNKIRVVQQTFAALENLQIRTTKDSTQGTEAKGVRLFSATGGQTFRLSNFVTALPGIPTQRGQTKFWPLF